MSHFRNDARAAIANGVAINAEIVELLKLMELQRHAMLVYTSCGWFFDELSGIETVQVLQYAGRALQLAEEVFKETYENAFAGLLELALSNIPEHGNGPAIYEKFVKPAMVDLDRVVAHYAVSCLFEGNDLRPPEFCYDINREHLLDLRSGRTHLVLGRITVTSQISIESKQLTFGVLHRGNHNVIGGVREYRGAAAYEALNQR